MDVYIARQPIFTKNKRVYAYELLFRRSMGKNLGQVSGNKATTSVLSSAFLTEGIEKISGSKPCFINFTEQLLGKDIAGFFSKTKIVIEILEDVEPTERVIEVCRELSEKGYLIALDDFVYARKLEPLIALADIIKIDFRLSTIDEIERMLYRLSRHRLKFLAEKIETYEEFDKALKLGFSYFQGYFFSRPETMRIREVASVKVNLMNLLAEVNRKKTTVDRLDAIISMDLGITYKLLRYINSAYYYLLHEVTSVRQAIIYLGAKEVRRFVTLVIISELASDKPEELVCLSITRGRFCELLADPDTSTADQSDLFLLGLFSLLDALLDTPMEEIMKSLPLADGVKKALVEGKGVLYPYLQLVTAYERGRCSTCEKVLPDLHLSWDQVSQHYLSAVEFADTICCGR
ncbi:MAG TPA: HDOD domain-containing protein [Desulfobulbus sp.]|nr:HDOD domain-containing protein [Desulfobulbus sp.]